MIPTTPEVANAMARLHNDEDFTLIRGWIEQSLNTHALGVMDLPAGPDTEQGKGYCKALLDIHESFKEPMKIVEKLKHKAERHAPAQKNKPTFF